MATKKGIKAYLNASNLRRFGSVSSADLHLVNDLLADFDEHEIEDALSRKA